jgi:hypothetical protein
LLAVGKWATRPGRQYENSKHDRMAAIYVYPGAKSMFVRTLFLFASLVSVVYANDRNSELYFPRNVVIEYNSENLELSLTGLTIRKKFFLNIYSMAHYAEQKPQSSDGGIYSDILESKGAKQISMIFLRSLKAKQIQNSLISGIKLNTSEQEYKQILPQVEEFMHAIHADVKPNDEFIIRWLPDGTLISLFQGQQINAIRNDKFAKTLWSIWFGEESVVDRKSLVKQLLSSL